MASSVSDDSRVLAGPWSFPAAHLRIDFLAADADATNAVSEASVVAVMSFLPLAAEAGALVASTDLSNSSLVSISALNLAAFVMSRQLARQLSELAFPSVSGLVVTAVASV